MSSTEGQGGGRRRLAVLGAGPIGLETALRGVLAGFDVRVYEKSTIAANVRDWGHVRLFSPFGMNSSRAGRDAVRASIGGEEMPDPDAILTGWEFADRYLHPLADSDALRGVIRLGAEVCAIGRRGLGKGDAIGKPSRAAAPFELLVRDERGERYVGADVVVDCTGAYPRGNAIGAGGLPCLGEGEVLTDAEYRLPEICGERFGDKAVLVIGAGHSAATTVVALEQLATAFVRTEVIWVTRDREGGPIRRFVEDPLPERDALAVAANAIAAGRSEVVRTVLGGIVRRVGREGDRIRVNIESADGEAIELVADEIVANVGYRPDKELYGELQVHQCYATEGPIKLAAALLGAQPVDGVIRSGQGAETLVNPEPGFFVLGAKSYGRNSGFLIAAGLEQVDELFSLIAPVSGAADEAPTVPKTDGRAPQAARSVPVVDLVHMDELWFQVAGTRCNLECTHCFISCGPKNDSFGNLSLAEIEARLEESIEQGVKEYYFTGGEPFLNPEMVPILERTLEYGPATVLTNATVLKAEWISRLSEARERTGNALEFRVSIDGPNAAMNDAIRGERAFERAMAGVELLVAHGFGPIITMTRTWGEADEAEILREFRERLREVGYERPRLKLLPRLQIGAEAERTEGYAEEERVTPKMMQGYDANQLLCSHSRIVTDRGVAVCPILIESPGAHLGQTLDEAGIGFPLSYGACYTCYLNGAICTNTSLVSGE